MSQQEIDCLTETSHFTMQCLELRRELLKLKEKRKIANKRSQDTKQHYENRLSSASKRFNRLLFGQTMVSTYFAAVKSQYDIANKEDMPVDYVLRKYAELIKYTRHQEIVNVYTNVLEQHNRESCKYLYKTKMNLVIGLGKQEEKLKTVNKELVWVISQKIACHYKEKYITNHGSRRYGSLHSSFLESLVVSRRSI